MFVRCIHGKEKAHGIRGMDQDGQAKLSRFAPDRREPRVIDPYDSSVRLGEAEPQLLRHLQAQRSTARVLPQSRHARLRESPRKVDGKVVPLREL